MTQQEQVLHALAIVVLQLLDTVGPCECPICTTTRAALADYEKLTRKEPAPETSRAPSTSENSTN